MLKLLDKVKWIGFYNNPQSITSVKDYLKELDFALKWESNVHKREAIKQSTLYICTVHFRHMYLCQSDIPEILHFAAPSQKELLNFVQKTIKKYEDKEKVKRKRK